MDDVPRRSITPEEIEENLRILEEHLKTVSGLQAQRVQEHIDAQKYALEGMRSGTVKIWQRIPEKTAGPY